jgi:hypothetical protein
MRGQIIGQICLNLNALQLWLLTFWIFLEESGDELKVLFLFISENSRKSGEQLRATFLFRKKKKEKNGVV